MITGCSSRQARHHEAQTFISQTLPFIASGENGSPGLANWGNVNAGAGLSINGDGTSLGLSVKPKPRKPSNTTKPISGNRKRLMTCLLVQSRPCGPRDA